jgi:hypothetical protein
MAVLDVLATTTTTGSAIRAAASSVPSLRKLSNLALNSANLILGGSGGQQAILGGVTQACSNPQLSCHNTTVVENLCCFNAPGGQLLQTQFWDTHPATGPDDSWTLHGLWPDRCDGSYDANCDSSRVYRNITDILTSFNRTDLLEYMHIYWKDYKGDDEVGGLPVSLWLGLLMDSRTSGNMNGASMGHVSVRWSRSAIRSIGRQRKWWIILTERWSCLNSYPLIR